jgi:hypothetical protein
MSNVRAHDPFSGHAPVDEVGDAGNDPKQPTRPGHHPPPPVTQPSVDPAPVDAPNDGLGLMSKAALVDHATDMGLATSGTKDDLIARIRADRSHSPK